MQLRKLALVASSLSAGGAERMISEMANYWAAAGHDVSVVTIASAAQDQYRLLPNVRRVALDLLWGSRNTFDSVRANVARQRGIRRALRDLNPRVIISFIDQTNVRVIAALLCSGIPVIVSERIDPRQHQMSRGWSMLRRMIYPFADALVVQTSGVGQWAQTVIQRRKIHVVPNFVRDGCPKSHETDHQQFRGSKTIIGMGRLDQQKGFDLMIEAFARAGGPELGWQLVVLGDGPERLRLERLGHSLGLQGHLQMPGIVREPFYWLKQADLFVLSSRYEGFPNALLDAMACGLPSIAFDCQSGPSEIIRHDLDGLLVPAGDVPALAEAIHRLMQSAEDRRRLAMRAPEVKQRFSRVDVMCRWERVIDDVLDLRGMQ